jgi:anti-sigma B factor antagonist
MTQPSLSVNVRKLPGVGLIDIQGDVTGSADEALTAAYNDSSGDQARAVILNFSALEYMNSTGIGLLVTLLIRAQRQKQQLLAFGLSEHYQEIFELTRLNEAIGIHPTEADALAALKTPA